MFYFRLDCAYRQCGMTCSDALEHMHTIYMYMETVATECRVH